MSTYEANICRERGNAPFFDNRFSRSYRIQFDDGAQWAGSSSPKLLPAPMSDKRAVDPEETYIAALSGCHMLFFLLIAAQRPFYVDHYSDTVMGVLESNETGRKAVTQVTLRPLALFSGAVLPSSAQVLEMHGKAHARCSLANSGRTRITCDRVL
jgi:organic hydroperoxide reductase OsmC/OhrA